MAEIYTRISTRRNPRSRTRSDVGNFLSRAAYICRGQSSGLARIYPRAGGVCVHTRVSPFSIPLDRTCREWRQPLLLPFTTRSPILSPRPRAPLSLPLSLSTTRLERHPPLPAAPRTQPRLSSIYKAAAHPFASVIPSANHGALRGFALRKAYSA